MTMKNNIEDTLITLAIHTFERAQILKTRLESEGIDVFLHNVNLISPTISAGVRVRIKESDLPKALSVIEKMDIPGIKDGILEDKNVKRNVILVPIDFSDYSMKACRVAFNLAYELKADIQIINAFNPINGGNMSLFEVFQYTKNAEEEKDFKHQLNLAQNDMKNVENQLNEDVKNGKLPQVKFHSETRVGIPEEEIATVTNEIGAMMIVMGTRGKNHKEQDLIGSVTAEIIERTTAPILAIPEDDKIDDFEEIKNVAFATSLDQRDLIAIDQMLRLFEKYKFKLWLLHIQQHDNKRVWNEVKLSGLKTYFKNNYPSIDIEFENIQDSDVLWSIDNFVREKGIELICLNNRKRNLISRLFNPNIAKRMVFHAKTPVFVLHS